MRGIRVFVPEKLRKLVLDELHATHFGTTRMKSLARAYCWWPGIDRNIENIVQNCIYCQLTRPNPVEAPLYPWETPCTPASSCRFCRSIFRALFFHFFNAFSKWPKVHIMKTIQTGETIKICRKTFAMHGLPQIFVSDHGV